MTTYLKKMELRRIVVVAAMIHRPDDDTILVAQRLNEGLEGLDGKWEFPGGKVDPGEEPRAALRREIREELGVDIEVGPIVETVHSLARGVDIVLLFYRCRLVAGDPSPLEVADWKWIPVAELDQVDIIEADREFVAKLAAAAKEGKRPLDFEHSF